MIYILSFIIFILFLFICFLVSCDKGQDKIIKKLRDENRELKNKYEQQLFELKKYKDEDKILHKEMARTFFTDTAYWMKRVFYYASENKKLREKDNKKS